MVGSNRTHVANASGKTVWATLISYKYTIDSIRITRNGVEIKFQNGAVEQMVRVNSRDFQYWDRDDNTDYITLCYESEDGKFEIIWEHYKVPKNRSVIVKPDMTADLSWYKNMFEFGKEESNIWKDSFGNSYE